METLPGTFSKPAKCLPGRARHVGKVLGTPALAPLALRARPQPHHLQHPDQRLQRALGDCRNAPGRKLRQKEVGWYQRLGLRVSSLFGAICWISTTVVLREVPFNQLRVKCTERCLEVVSKGNTGQVRLQQQPQGLRRSRIHQLDRSGRKAQPCLLRWAWVAMGCDRCRNPRGREDSPTGG